MKLFVILFVGLFSLVTKATHAQSVPLQLAKFDKRVTNTFVTLFSSGEWRILEQQRASLEKMYTLGKRSRLISVTKSQFITNGLMFFQRVLEARRRGYQKIMGAKLRDADLADESWNHSYEVEAQYEAENTKASEAFARAQNEGRDPLEVRFPERPVGLELFHKLFPSEVAQITPQVRIEVANMEKAYLEDFLYSVTGRGEVSTLPKFLEPSPTDSLPYSFSEVAGKDQYILDRPTWNDTWGIRDATYRHPYVKDLLTSDGYHIFEIYPDEKVDSHAVKIRVMLRRRGQTNFERQILELKSTPKLKTEIEWIPLEEVNCRNMMNLDMKSL